MHSRWKKLLASGAVCTLLIAQQPVSQGPQAGNAAAWLVVGGGTAGSPGTAVLTIQGIGSGTAVPVTLSGTVSIAGVPTTSSSNAFTIAHAATAAAANIKASAGNLYGMVLGNSNSTACWVQLFNNAGTPTAGTSVIDSYLVQAGVTISIPPGLIALENFATGIAFAGATTDSGATTTGCTTGISTTFYFK